MDKLKKTNTKFIDNLGEALVVLSLLAFMLIGGVTALMALPIMIFVSLVSGDFEGVLIFIGLEIALVYLLAGALSVSKKLKEIEL